MPDPDSRPEQDAAGDRHPVDADAVASTEYYRTDEGVVFYDADNPLAWIQADATLTLTELV